MRGFPVSPIGLAQVLAGLSYPARTWQLLAQADYYGADYSTRAELARLPVGTYDSLDAVLEGLLGVQRRRESITRVPHVAPATRATPATPQPRASRVSRAAQAS